MVRFKLNGEEVEAPKGSLLIRIAHDRGIDVPFFCYHPGLTPEGNCRMCLVEASNSRKPVPACTTPVAEGIEVQTHSEAAKSARADVLEFMLVNHPLDCPICDKSGECMLQDHAYDHGKDRSRMVEQKELKHTKDLGNDVHLWGNRCIVCTRCVRFCDEVAGTGELTVVERGDHSVIDVFPGYPLQNPLSGNVVDICPVGALIDKDFLYEARVWYEKKTDTVCNSCARGCNIEVQTLHNKVKRLVPRHNPDVNGYWMCDHGRYDYKHILGPNRWLRYRLGDSSAPGEAADYVQRGLAAVIEENGPQAIGGVISGFATLETVYLFRRLFESRGVAAENLAARARPDGEEEVFPGFRISADKNPNRTGVQRILGHDAFEREAGLLEKIRSGTVRGLVLFSDLPGCPLEDRWIEVLEKLDFAVVVLLEGDDRLPESTGIIPATAFSEKEGSIINEDDRLQLLNKATELPRGILPEYEILQEALRLGGYRRAQMSAAGIFQELGTVIPELGEKSRRDVGAAGIPLKEPVVPAGGGS